MTRKYTRDNRGRFSSTGATARGGRLKTASGGKRETQTMKAEKPKGTVKVQGKVRRDPEAASKIGQQKPEAKKPVAKKPEAKKPEAKKPMPKGNAPKRLEYTLLYHGTSTDIADKIRGKGGSYRESSDGFVGKGVYASRNKRVAEGYARMRGELTANRSNVLTHRVMKGSIDRLKGDDYAVQSKKATSASQASRKKGRVASLYNDFDLQDISLMSAKTANKTLVRGSSSTIRAQRKKRGRGEFSPEGLRKGAMQTVELGKRRTKTKVWR